MLLGEILHRDVIKIGLDSQDRFATIRELIDLLIESGDLPLSLREHVVEVVFAREKSMGTGMEMGVALPHGSSERVDRLVGAMGIAPEGIPFESLDGQPAKLILLLVLPRDEFHQHVRTLAGISHLLNEDAFREALMNATDADTILARIRSEEESSLFDRFRAWRKKK